MIKNLNRRIIATVTALIIALFTLPSTIIAGATDFIPENLLQTDLLSKKTVVKNISAGNVYEHNQFNGAGTLAIINDGDTDIKVDAYGANDWGHNSGVVFELNNTAFCGNASIYAGFPDYPDTYDVYASDSEDTLYSSASLVASGVVCTGSKASVTINREVKYLAVFLTDYTYNGRIAEIELWSADKDASGEPTETLENVLISHTESVNGILFDRQTGAVTANDQFDKNGAIAGATDTVLDAHYDVWGWDANTGVGVLYTLDSSYYIDKIVIYSGFEAYPDSYRIYASDDMGTMYSSESLLASDLVCTGTVELKTEATFKYIAFIFDSDGGRVKEFEVYAGKNQGTPFVPENLLQTDLLSKTAVVKNISAGNVYDHSQFNGAGTIDIINDGDTDTKVDAYGANDWGHNSGVLFQLNNSAYCGEVKIYSGYEEYPDTYDVYASADLSSLYEDASRVATGVVCTGTAASVTVNREIKYLAVFLTDYTYNGRIAEIELWSAQKTDSGEQGGDPTPEDPTPEDPTPEDPTPEDPTPEDPTPEDPTPEEPAVSNNFISKHRAKGGASGVLGDVANGGFSDGDRFSAAQSDALDVAIDGDTETYFQVWGALDWEYPKNVGARYTLDALYQVDYAYITAGTAETPVTFDVYASDAVGTLFGEGNLVKSGVVCKGDTVKVEVNRLVSCVAFIITKYDLASNTAMISEFDLSGSEKAVEKEVIKWPAVPSGENILKKAVAKEIIAPNGDFSGTKEYDYRFMDMQTESDLSKLTDGDLVKHYDIWSLTEKDKPGVLYELDAYYDLTHLHGWAGVFESELLTNFGYKVYAADNAETLFKSKNLVFTHSNSSDTTNEFGVNVSLSRIKYIAFILTDSSDNAWRMREFAAFGTPSANQSAPAVQASIIEGIEAEYYGVATDNLADPIYMGASAYIETLSDGKRDPVEFWGGKDTDNSKFVFIYDLYANYDITGIDIFASPDNIEEDSGIHKGIRSAKVYASRKFADLFSGAPIVLKEDYSSQDAPDEEAYYSADAPSDWKNVRFIAYVFTIGDWRYGACRLEELKAFGVMSAVQDEEEEEEKLPEYIDLKTADGFLLRIYALDGSDDLSKLGAILTVETLTDKKDLEFVNNSLSGYDALALYKVSLTDGSGNPINTGGRKMRVSLPGSDENVKIACVDDYSAEIISSGVLDDHITVQTETLRSYASVKQVSGVMSGFFSADNLAPAVIAVLALAGALGIAFAAITVVKIKKTK